jgi:hypothetical protein
MYSVTRGEVTVILHDDPELQELLVQIPGKSQPERAYNYPALNRRIETGELVLLNTSAVKLGLGTGGRHFVIPYAETVEQDSAEQDFLGNIQTADPVSRRHKGHIMKLRYTPWQFPVLAVEEEASPYHERLKSVTSLDGVPVVTAPLHSMLPGIILGFRALWQSSGRNQNPKIVYVMTDGAALPIALSNIVRELKDRNYLQTTITTGHAFGGDLEAVSIPSALQAAKAVGNADLIIIALGPGIVGTGTALGFSSIEQSWVVDVVTRLKGYSITVPRISEADLRERHKGMSHHSLTILEFANHPSSLAISSRLPQTLRQQISTQLSERDLLNKHFVWMIDDPPALQLFQEAQMEVKSMGRGISQDPSFFQTTISAGYLAATVAIGKLSSLPRIQE